jgi:hypothetical protein
MKYLFAFAFFACAFMGCDSDVGAGGDCPDSYLIDHYDTQGDLPVVSNCTTIVGSLDIEHTNLTDLDFLSGLISVGGWMTIRINLLLTDIGGLSNLESVGLGGDGSYFSPVGVGGVEIAYNPALCQSLVDEFVSGITVGTGVEATGSKEDC